MSLRICLSSPTKILSDLMPPVVSVIIPTFNRENFLKEAIDSVLAQDFSGIELIVVNDGSGDDTDKLLAGYGSALRSIMQDNKGVSAARNAGIRMAAGEYIAFLDSDDVWLPKKIEKQMDFFASHPCVSICQTDEIWIRRGERVNPKKVHKKESGWIFNRCVELCIVSPSAVMLKKGVFDDIGLFDESLPACEDYDLWLRASLKYEIHTLAEKLIVKRGGHDDQLSRQWGLDRYRVIALRKILASPLLTDAQRSLVETDIARRTAIFENGAKKRFRAKNARPPCPES